MAKIDLMLRSEVPSALTFSQMDGNLHRVETELNARYVDGIKNLSTTALTPQRVIGYYVGSSLGGGVFLWDATKSKTLHNGGTVIAPEAITAWDGTNANLSTILSWTGTGSGCFVRVPDAASYNVEIFGGLRSPSLCTESLQKLIDTTDRFEGVTGAEYLTRQINITKPAYINLNQCTIYGENVVNSNGFYVNGVKGITIRNGTMKHTKTVGVYVQAITMINCESVLLEDLNLDGFSQFTMQFSHSLNRTFSGFVLRRVHVTNGGNFLADASAVANCMEWFNRNSESYRTDTLIEDCSFSLMDGAKANVCKLGVGSNTVVKRCKFYSKDRTSAGSSGIQSGATGNINNGKNRVTWEDCVFEMSNTLDNYYMVDGVGSQSFYRCRFIGDDGNVYAIPKGTESQKWKFVDCELSNNFKYDNPTIQVDSIDIIRTKMYRLIVQKDAGVVAAGLPTVTNLNVVDSVFDLFTLGNADIKNVNIRGAGTYIPQLGFAGDLFTYGNIRVSDSAAVDQIVYNTNAATTSVNSIVLDGAIVKKLSLRTNGLKNLLVKNTELIVSSDMEHYVNGSDSCTFMDNYIRADVDAPPTVATNMIVFYNNCNFTGNVIENIPNRSNYVVAVDCDVLMYNNMLKKSNNSFTAKIGTGKVKQTNTICNGVLFPSNFDSLLLDISQPPTAHYQLAISGSTIYMSNGTSTNLNWKQIS